jgi:ATP-dependent protease Clp ATPase subunit
MEELMVDLMYQLPEESKPSQYTITPDVIEGKADPFEQARKTQKESA